MVSRDSDAGGDEFYTFDPSGSVAQRQDGGGGLLSSDVYDGFGNLQATTGGGADVFGFAGQWGGYTDAETGLVLMTHRFYDPQAGRFLTRDPINFYGCINLYAFTTNNPVNFADPLVLYVTIPIEHREDCEERCLENYLTDSSTCKKISNPLDRVKCYIEEGEKLVKCLKSCGNLPPRPCDPQPDPVWPYPDPLPDWPPTRKTNPIWPIWPVYPWPVPVPI